MRSLHYSTRGNPVTRWRVLCQSTPPLSRSWKVTELRRKHGHRYRFCAQPAGPHDLDDSRLRVGETGANDSAEAPRPLEDYARDSEWADGDGSDLRAGSPMDVEEQMRLMMAEESGGAEEGAKRDMFADQEFEEGDEFEEFPGARDDFAEDMRDMGDMSDDEDDSDDSDSDDEEAMGDNIDLEDDNINTIEELQAYLRTLNNGPLGEGDFFEGGDDDEEPNFAPIPGCEEDEEGSSGGEEEREREREAEREEEEEGLGGRGEMPPFRGEWEGARDGRFEDGGFDDFGPDTAGDSNQGDYHRDAYRNKFLRP